MVVEILIALTQFSFVISHVVFLIQSCKTTIDTLLEVDSKIGYYILAVCTILTLLSWVRNLAKFSFTFIVGNFLIITAVIYVSVYAGKLLSQDGIGPGI